MDNEKELILYSIGGKYPYEIDGEFGIMFEDGVLELIANLPNLNDREIEAFENNEFDIKICYVEGEMFFTFCLKEFLGLCDVAYSPHLTRYLKLTDFIDDSGYMLNFILVDAVSNVIKGIRVLGPGKEFSNKFNGLIKEVNKKPFVKEEYLEKIQKIRKKYTTYELNFFKVCEFRFIGHNKK